MSKTAAQKTEMTAIATPRKLTCDICEQPILADEPHIVTDVEYGEGEHKACTAHWFRSNFGAEDLR